MRHFDIISVIFRIFQKSMPLIVRSPRRKNVFIWARQFFFWKKSVKNSKKVQNLRTDNSKVPKMKLTNSKFFNNKWCMRMYDNSFFVNITEFFSKINICLAWNWRIGKKANNIEIEFENRSIFGRNNDHDMHEFAPHREIPHLFA